MQILKVESLKPLFYKNFGEKDITCRRIKEIVDAIYDLNTFGICLEQTTGRVESEVIVFGRVSTNCVWMKKNTSSKSMTKVYLSLRIMFDMVCEPL